MCLGIVAKADILENLAQVDFQVQMAVPGRLDIVAKAARPAGAVIAAHRAILVEVDILEQVATVVRVVTLG